MRNEMLKTLCAALVALCISSVSFAQAAFDVRHYSISLSITDVNSRAISGCTTVRILSQTNGLQQVTLSLLQLSVASVTVNSSNASYTHNDTTLVIQLPAALNAGDSTEVLVCYNGQPIMDASGWGGFYFSGTYAFNLGVGFDANPHAYGRVWFPCVDNFTDRATFEFHITTAGNQKAFCNGLFIDSTLNGNGTITWDWQLNQTIPTYLASVAVSNYTSLDDNYQSISGNTVPVMLAAQPSDTAKLRGSFVHLPNAFTGFEDCFGPYLFDRVGFVLVPFNRGAMEHATNVAYMRAAVTGGLESESLMAHEFSHHWFGNLVTCSTPEDMWLNEGWARYSESVFFEKVYGTDRYKKNIRTNHKDVLHFTHLTDDGYRAVSGVPHEYTYGSTVYDKGAEVAHTLRGYMGDSLFFSCVADYLDAFKFNHASSIDFRDHLSQCSGIDLTAFFQNWVFNPGFPHFSVDSFFAAQSGSNYDVTVFIRQRLKAAPELYANVPLQVTFFSQSFDSLSQTVLFSGGCGIHHTELPFEPVFVAVDFNEKLSDAITDKHLMIDSTGNYDFEEALMTMDVTQVSSDALVRVEHNWIAPDPLEGTLAGLHISKERYWKVDGIFPTPFTASATITYDGSTSTSTGNLDNLLITNSEDSLVIFYRPDSKTEWAPHPAFTVNTQGSLLNKRGQITINNIAKGEYALGIRDNGRPLPDTTATPLPCYYIGTKELGSIASELAFGIFPNPANDSFYIKFEKALTTDVNVSIIDLTGKVVQTFTAKSSSQQLNIATTNWGGTTYLVKVESAKGLAVKKLLILN